MNSAQIKAIDRIKKCMALAKSANGNEAAVALKQAQMLMEKYGISEDEIALSQIVEDFVALRSRRLPAWHAALLNTIAEGFGCSFYTTTRNYDYVVQFVGLPMRVEVATYAYTVLRRHILGGRKVFISQLSNRCKKSTKTAKADAWCEGFVIALVDKIKAFVASESEQALIQQYLITHYPNLAKASLLRDSKKDVAKRDRLGNERYQGFKAGKKVELNRAVHGGQSTKQLEAR